MSRWKESTDIADRQVAGDEREDAAAWERSRLGYYDDDDAAVKDVVAEENGDEEGNEGVDNGSGSEEENIVCFGLGEDDSDEVAEDEVDGILTG